MKKISALVASALVLLPSFSAQAGGLNEAVDETVEEKAPRSGIILPLLLLVAVVAAASSTSTSREEE